MIVLIGFMGSGKTTVARMLAARLGLPYVDTDAKVERRAGRTIAEIFASDGETRFRELERSAVTASLAGPDAVVSLGGGAVTDTGVRESLGAHRTIFLDVEVSEAIRRARSDGATRPLLAQHDPVDLYELRRPLYASVAELTVDTTHRQPEEVAADIAVHLDPIGSSAAGQRKVRVVTSTAAYQVVIGSGVSSDVAAHVELARAEKAFLITHPSLGVHVSPVASSLTEAGLTSIVIEVPEGEGSKSLASASDLYERLASAKAHRHDLVVTLGGGVVSDLGGFVASTYMRGLPLLALPSTLLGQVDAAVGGKTGVNLRQGKNLVGTIYQPRAVLCDIDLLRTCPSDEIRSGLAEVVKYGFIADPSLLEVIVSSRDRIEGLDTEVMTQLVARSVAVKASVVATDEREEGDRAFLNYGHTFAHAIETVLGYGGIRHGEAVSLGMMAAAYTAAELGRIGPELVDMHRNVLSAVGLPVSRELDYASLSSAWEQDKKFVHGPRFVLLRALGQPEAGVPVEPEVLRAAVTRLAREDVT